MKIIEPLKNVYCIEYNKLSDLSMAFVRIQEFSDGLFFKGEVFELDKFIKLWSEKKGDGRFTYPELWNGYNVSGKIFEEWKMTVKATSKFRKEEIELLNVLRDKHGSVDFRETYIFGVALETSLRERKIVIEHEIAHALYYQYPHYKKKTNSKVKNLPHDFLNKAEVFLHKRGYARSAFRDEIQAYLASDDLINGVLGIKTLKCNMKNSTLLEGFKQYYESFKSSL